MPPLGRAGPEYKKTKGDPFGSPFHPRAPSVLTREALELRRPVAEGIATRGADFAHQVFEPRRRSVAWIRAVYVFGRSGASWTQEAYLKASNTDADDSFGWSLALAGDMLAVGAVDESSAATSVGGDQSDNSAEQSGAVYAFPIQF